MLALVLLGMTAGVIVVMDSPPQIPPLSSDSEVVVVADVLRVVMLISGAAILAVCARHLMVLDPENDDRFLEGFRWRTIAIMFGSVFVGLGMYARIGEPVTLSFVVAIPFLIASSYSVHVATSLPPKPLPSEADLAAFDWRTRQ